MWLQVCIRSRDTTHVESARDLIMKALVCMGKVKVLDIENLVGAIYVSPRMPPITILA